MATQNPIQVLDDARRIAREHGMFIVGKPGRYIVYRKCSPNNIRLGHRSNAADLRAFVSSCAAK